MWKIYIIGILCLICCILGYRIYKCLPGLCPKKRNRINNIKIMVVLGSGGHTGEMMPIIGKISDDKRFLRTKFIFISSQTDSLSFQHPLIPEHSDLIQIPRSRNVGQSFFTSIFTTFYSFASSLKLILKTPDVLLVNGPGVCFPVVISIFLGNILGICSTSIVFIESFCRVKSLSLTAKLIYPFCDLFFVQWPSLLHLKKRAQLINIFNLDFQQFKK